MAKERKQDTKIKKLLEKGRKDGFITQEDVLALFPRAEEHIAELDDMYGKLLEERIDVFEASVAGLEEDAKIGRAHV